MNIFIGLHRYIQGILVLNLCSGSRSCKTYVSWQISSIASQVKQVHFHEHQGVPRLAVHLGNPIFVKSCHASCPLAYDSVQGKCELLSSQC
jgi:hypothetical protein